MKRNESFKAREDILQAASQFHGAYQPTHSPKPLPMTTTDPGPAAAHHMIKDTGTIVVVQHEGILDRLATDSQRSPLTRASTQRLSENLAKVSKAVAQLGSVDEHPVQTSTEPDRSQAEHPEPQPLRPLKIKSCSMSELLEDLHTIAADMNIDLSDPAKEDAFVQARSYITPIHSPYAGFFDAEGLLNEPTRLGDMPAKLDHVAEKPAESVQASVPTSEQSVPHVEDATSLLSEPTSPGPMSDEALGEAIAEHARSQALRDTVRSPPSSHVTALPTRNSSVREPIPLPSSILCAVDYSPIAAGPASQLPSSHTITSPVTSTAPRFAPRHYPTSPMPLSPWSIQSPKPTKRVRTTNRWPLEHEFASSPESETSESDQAYIATELHKAVQEVAARERELHRAIREAAETEGGLRRRVVTRRRMGGASKE